MTKIDLLLEWLQNDAAYFAEQLKDERKFEKEAVDGNNVPVEFYRKGKIAAYESVLRVAYKPYLDMLISIANEQEGEKHA